MTLGCFRFPAAGILLLICFSGLEADILHLKDGRRIRVAEWRETKTEYVYDRFGGTVSIPKSLVARVERTPVVPPPPQPKPSKPVPPNTPSTTRALPAPPVSMPVEANGILQGHYEKGERARLASRFEAAVRAYEEVLRLDPAHLDAGVYRTACYLWMERYDEALSAAQESMLYHPEDPSLLFIAGEVYYYQGRLGLAVDSWERALAFRDHPSIRARIEKARRELNTEETYRALGGGQFRLRYDGDGGSEDLAREVLEFLEDRIGELSLRLDHFPAAPIPVILYPDREFHAATLADHNVQGLFDGKVRVSVGGVTGLAEPLRRVLEHELAHALIDSKSAGNCPRWLHEGLAQHLSGDSSVPFRRDLGRQYLQLAGSEDWHPGMSYPAALSCVDFVISQHGFRAWLSILDRIGRGKKFSEALWETLRMRPQELFAAWGEDLQSGVAARR